MPTAEAFEMFAATLDAGADELEVVMVPLRSIVEVDVMAGGGLRADLVTRLDDDEAWIAIEVRQLRDAADECRRRAAVCRAAEEAAVAYAVSVSRYERALAAWRHDGTSGSCGPRPLPPVAPVAPPSWVEW